MAARAGLYGWKVTDCKSVLNIGLTIVTISTPQTFGCFHRIGAGFKKKQGTELLEPYLPLIYAPQKYLSRAYHDAPGIVQRYCKYSDKE